MCGSSNRSTLGLWRWLRIRRLWAREWLKTPSSSLDLKFNLIVNNTNYGEFITNNGCYNGVII